MDKVLYTSAAAAGRMHL